MHCAVHEKLGIRSVRRRPASARTTCKLHGEDADACKVIDAWLDCIKNTDYPCLVVERCSGNIFHILVSPAAHTRAVQTLTRRQCVRRVERIDACVANALAVAGLAVLLLGPGCVHDHRGEPASPLAYTVRDAVRDLAVARTALIRTRCSSGRTTLSEPVPCGAGFHAFPSFLDPSVPPQGEEGHLIAVTCTGTCRRVSKPSRRSGRL